MTSDKALGFRVVIAGIIGILVALWVVLSRFSAANDVLAVLGPVTTAIAGLGGAFFGISLGQAGKAETERQKDKAQRRAELYAGRLSAQDVQQLQPQIDAI